MSGAEPSFCCETEIERKRTKFCVRNAVALIYSTPNRYNLCLVHTHCIVYGSPSFAIVCLCDGENCPSKWCCCWHPKTTTHVVYVCVRVNWIESTLHSTTHHTHTMCFGCTLGTFFMSYSVYYLRYNLLPLTHTPSHSFFCYFLLRTLPCSKPRVARTLNNRLVQRAQRCAVIINRLRWNSNSHFL